MADSAGRPRSRIARWCCAIVTFIVALTTAVVVAPTARAGAFTQTRLNLAMNTGTAFLSCITEAGSTDHDPAPRPGNCVMDGEWLDTQTTVNGTTVHSLQNTSSKTCIDMAETPDATTGRVWLGPCNPKADTQRWVWANGQFRDYGSTHSQCLTLVDAPTGVPGAGPDLILQTAVCQPGSVAQAVTPLINVATLPVKVAVDNQNPNAKLRIQYYGKTATGVDWRGTVYDATANLQFPPGYYGILVSAQIGSRWAPIDVTAIRSPFGGDAHAIAQGTAVDRISIPASPTLPVGEYDFLAHLPAAG